MKQSGVLSLKHIIKKLLENADNKKLVGTHIN